MLTSNTFSRHECFHAPANVEPGMNLSLKNLRMDYCMWTPLMHFLYAYAISLGYATQRTADRKVRSPRSSTWSLPIMFHLSPSVLHPVIDILPSRAFYTI